MKNSFLFISLGAYVDGAIGDSRMLRGLVDYKQCEIDSGRFSVDNGQVSCKGSSCSLEGCSAGYHRLKTKILDAKKAKCVTNFNGAKWNRSLFQCRTCSNLAPLSNNPEFKVKCGFISKQSGTFRLKKCNFECANGGLIAPINKYKVS